MRRAIPWEAAEECYVSCPEYRLAEGFLSYIQQFVIDGVQIHSVEQSEHDCGVPLVFGV